MNTLTPDGYIMVILLALGNTSKNFSSDGIRNTFISAQDAALARFFGGKPRDVSI